MSILLLEIQLGYKFKTSKIFSLSCITFYKVIIILLSEVQHFPSGLIYLLSFCSMNASQYISPFYYWCTFKFLLVWGCFGYSFSVYSGSHKLPYFGYIKRSRIVGSCVCTSWSRLDNTQLFSKAVVPIYIHTSQYMSSIVRLCSRCCWCPTHILWHSLLSCMAKTRAFNCKHLQLFSWRLFFFFPARAHLGPQWSSLEIPKS